MMLRKSCPRCSGDLFLDRSDGPAAWTCLQCGRAFTTAAMQADAPVELATPAGARVRAA